MGVPRRVAGIVGYSEGDTLKNEKGDAVMAMLQLLCAESEECRQDFQRRIMNAKSSNEISRIMADVRERL